MRRPTDGCRSRMANHCLGQDEKYRNYDFASTIFCCGRKF